MKFYYLKENRIIETEELTQKYGADSAIPLLGIFDLSMQPAYTPVGFNHLSDNTYYPIESYDEVKARCVDALIATGMTEEEALNTIENP
jgi:hypothetical protein